VNQENRTAIDKIESGKRSDFVNRALAGPLKALDPGTSCKDVLDLKQWLQSRMSEAQRDNDHARVQVIAMWQESTKPELQLCELEKKPTALVENNAHKIAQSSEPGAAIIDYLKRTKLPSPNGPTKP